MWDPGFLGLYQRPMSIFFFLPIIEKDVVPSTIALPVLLYRQDKKVSEALVDSFLGLFLQGKQTGDH